MRQARVVRDKRGDWSVFDASGEFVDSYNTCKEARDMADRINFRIKVDRYLMMRMREVYKDIRRKFRLSSEEAYQFMDEILQSM